MTVECLECGKLSKESKQPLKFLLLREYKGSHGNMWYFCDWPCLYEFVKRRPHKVPGRRMNE